MGFQLSLFSWGHGGVGAAEMHSTPRGLPEWRCSVVLHGAVTLPSGAGYYRWGSPKFSAPWLCPIACFLPVFLAGYGAGKWFALQVRNWGEVLVR